MPSTQLQGALYHDAAPRLSTPMVPAPAAACIRSVACSVGSQAPTWVSSLLRSLPMHPSSHASPSHLRSPHRHGVCLQVRFARLSSRDRRARVAESEYPPAGSQCARAVPHAPCSADTR
eukprot:2462755-Rhodomonas_salina.1